jgi:hypothetical protein
MASSPWKTLRVRALLRLRRDGSQIYVFEMLPADGTIAAVTMKRTSARPAGNSVTTLSQSDAIA